MYIYVCMYACMCIYLWNLCMYVLCVCVCVRVRACMCIYLWNLILLCCWVFSNVFRIGPIIESEKLLVHGSMV